jgi:hypothetical protein
MGGQMVDPSNKRADGTEIKAILTRFWFSVVSLWIRSISSSERNSFWPEFL